LRRVLSRRPHLRGGEEPRDLARGHERAFRGDGRHLRLPWTDVSAASVLKRKHRASALDGTRPRAVDGRVRSVSGEPGSESAAGGRSLLVERAASALAHAAKNPLHKLALHLQLVTEKRPG